MSSTLCRVWQVDAALIDSEMDKRPAVTATKASRVEGEKKNSVRFSVSSIEYGPEGFKEITLGGSIYVGGCGCYCSSWLRPLLQVSRFRERGRGSPV